MSIEIERKFLVLNDTYRKESYQKIHIIQGFLNSDKHRVVRIRITDDKSFLTIKGVSDKKGLSRFEWEKKIPTEEAKQLLLLCEEGVIEKYRYLVKNDHHIIEIDEFLGDNKGLLIAEIELSSESEIIKKPSWIGKEVTGQIKYYNSTLSKHPFKNWT